MKKYIFITFSIVNVGGSQLYVRNKAAFLQEQGWDVDVFSATEGVTLIKDLECFQSLIIPDLRNAPQVLPYKLIAAIVDKIVGENLSEYTDFVIESHSTVFGLWGELAAKKARGKHLLYSVEETNHVINTSHLNFVKYKWEQRAFASIVNTSLSSFFEKYGILISSDKSYWLPAYCNNPVEDISSSFVLPDADYTICLFARLNKGFMLPSAKTIADYIVHNTQTTYNVVVIGGGERSDYRNLESVFEGLPNCHLLMTGHLFPIPYDFITKMDVVVSSAGCCWVTYNLGIVTISIDGHDYEPIGVIGETTKHSLFRVEEVPMELSDLLNSVLIDKKYNSSIKTFSPVKYDFSEHLYFIEKMTGLYQYFDVMGIYFQPLYLLTEKIKRTIYRLFGAKFYLKLSQVKRR